MRDLTIAVGVARALADLATLRGADRATLLRRANIAEADLLEQEARLPFERYIALMRAGQDLCGDPALALHFGEYAPLAELSIGLAASGFSPTMSECLALANRFAPLIVEVDTADSSSRFSVMHEGDRVWLVDTRRSPNDFPELTESTFARAVCLARAVMGTGYILHEVHVTHPEPTYRAEYDRIFRAPIVFASTRNALLTNAAWVSQFPLSGSRPMFELLRARSEELLGRLKRSKSVRGRVEAALEKLLPGGETNMTRVTRALGISRQTLFRRLRAEGVTFEEVLDDLRRRLALEYFDQPGTSIGDVAYRLGYSEPSAFSRAFKRWTGSSPGAALRKRTRPRRG